MWNFPGKNTGLGCHSLLQGIFLTQGSNPCLWHLLHWQVSSSPLRHLESPTELYLLRTGEWSPYLENCPRNRTWSVLYEPEFETAFFCFPPHSHPHLCVSDVFSQLEQAEDYSIMENSPCPLPLVAGLEPLNGPLAFRAFQALPLPQSIIRCCPTVALLSS